MDAEIDELLNELLRAGGRWDIIGDELLGADGRQDIIGYDLVTEPKSGVKFRINLSSYCPPDFNRPLAMNIARRLAGIYGVALGLYNEKSGANNQPRYIPIFSVTCYYDGELDEERLYIELQKIINAADELEERCRMIVKLEEKMEMK